ncbi:AraC-type DNA-binding protein [Pseudomonas flavescens]|uniref:AraC-type DNA-binding protein n=1 Tax=Phytopseudomonas flavescens TaxID=29435 RepID=A0A1G8BET0_9GAMM|nr:AraC family transcriptional regulator [Pseudomonas flavescens]SDH31742.1 AraC-type DNA-binding protein [Pseudomonas flavescens]
MLHSHLTTLHAVVLALDTLCQNGDCNAHELLAGSGIAAADLQRPEMRISIAQERQVFRNATGWRQDLGLLLGRRMHVSSYGLLGFSLLSAPTLGEALAVAFSFPALLGTLFDLRLHRDGSRAWIEASHYRDTAELETFNTEFCLASLKLICDDLLGRPLPLEAARFSHRAPRYQRQYRRDFACAVRFNAADNAIVFDSQWLDRRLPLADPVTHRDTLERCRQLNREFISHQALISRVRQLLASQLPMAPGLDGLARQLRCSSRTLRRQLQEVGSSYQTLLDELRFEQARQLLDQERLPVARIAEALGYSETASFRHAFQRWSGVSPSRYRRPANA